MIKILDILARVGIAGGIGMILQPWWAGGFRYGFFVTLAFMILHITTSHLISDSTMRKEAHHSFKKKHQRIGRSVS